MRRAPITTPARPTWADRAPDGATTDVRQARVFFVNCNLGLYVSG